MADIGSFDRQRAEREVDKFLLDAEMLNMYIQYQKEVEKDPDFKVPGAAGQEEEGLFSFRTLIYGYLGYVAFTTIPVAFKKYVAQQAAEGNWHGTGIKAIDDWLANSPLPEVKAEAAANAVQAVSDAVQSSGMQ